MNIGTEELNAVARVINSGELSGYQGNFSEKFHGGNEVRATEKAWALYFGSKHAIFCNSNSSGLWASLNAIGIKPGDEVLVSPYSMTVSASIPFHFGAKPIFVDIEEGYYCIDPEKIEDKITEKTKAIIAVDLFGLPCDFDRINAIAKKHRLIVIEDAAQSIGAKYKGRYAGTLADIGVHSLNYHKHITCGEAGVILTDNDDLAFKLKLSINHAEAVVNDIERQGILDQFDNSIVSMVGLNLRGTELQAAIAREQLKKLEGVLERVRSAARFFDVKTRSDCEHAFYRYAMPNDSWIESVRHYKGTLFNWKNHYITPLYKMPLFKALGYQDGLCPACEEVEEDIVLAWLKETP
jgi:dTDP-4-amino-4,6-dideoxygalactose transaminase